MIIQVLITRIHSLFIIFPYFNSYSFLILSPSFLFCVHRPYALYVHVVRVAAGREAVFSVSLLVSSSADEKTATTPPPTITTTIRKHHHVTNYSSRKPFIGSNSSCKKVPHISKCINTSNGTE